jgi:hypothetical protein
MFGLSSNNFIRYLFFFANLTGFQQWKKSGLDD